MSAGTLAAIIREVADHLKIDREDIVREIR